MSVGQGNMTTTRSTEVDKKEQLKKMKKITLGPARSPRYEFTMNRSFSKSFEKPRSGSVGSVTDTQVTVPTSTGTASTQQAPLKRMSSNDIKVKPKGFLTSF